PRRRRRRGGRGGRNRKADQNDATEGSGEAPGGSDDAGGAEDDGADRGAASPAEDGGAASDGDGDGDASGEGGEAGGSGSRRRRRRRRKGGGSDGAEGDGGADEPAEPRSGKQKSGRKKNNDEVTSVKGSTRLEAKKQRRREGRSNRGSRAPILTEAEFLARRESVERQMVVRQRGELTQIAVLEDDVLVEHYVSSASSSSMIGNVYLGRVQNVLPSMEAAFVDIGRGRNAVLYAGEVNWDAAGLEGQPKRIELALSSGDTVLVQVTKDPVGHKGARLTSQISLPGRFLVYVPQGGMTGISRKLPDRERSRLKKILREVVPDDAGVIVRTAAEGATEEQLAQDVERLAAEWERISQQAKKGSAPSVLRAEPDLAIKVARDIFNEDFASMVVSGDRAFEDVKSYVDAVAPDLGQRVSKWVGTGDLFRERRIDEQLAKALDRKVWLPSGGSLVIDRTEAMTVVDVNTGKFTGKGGNLEETVTRNNLEAAEEIVRQLRLRDIGGIIVIDFIDMVLEDNRDLVLRRLVECLSRDRTKHQVAEVTSLGLVQMTRKRIGQGLMETFSTTCEVCNGRGVKVQLEPVGAEKSEERATRPRRPRVTGPIPGAPTTHRHTEDVAAPDVEDAVVVELSAEEELAAAALEAQEAAALADAEGAAIIEDTPSDDDVHGAVD
ncbi:MAG: Rne/Rng family ribonuclease, partial [Actinobacteria bacterium]